MGSIMKCLTLITLVLGTTLASGGNTWKLNVPRVLLPLTEEGANFKLFSKGGCFTWKSTRPEVIVLTPIPDLPDHCVDQSSPVQNGQLINEVPKCTSAALVSISGNLHSSIGKTQAVVMAEDFNSPGRVLRADVIADTIRSLQIVTKTHELFLEEAPEEFAVRAYDDQGNEFSTLDGMIFKWTILDKQSGNIRFIKFRDSSYALDPVLEEIEAKGLQGSKVLLEGIKTGSAKVSVRLASKAQYATMVPSTEVSVLVVANLFLVPPVAFVMFGATVNYHAEQIKSNKIRLVDLISSAQYFLEVEDTGLVTVDTSKAEILAGNELGFTRVLLRDKNVELRTDLGEVELKSPSADLHVVEPDHISIEIDPFKSWIVIVGNKYELSVDIFDGENRKLFPSANLVVKIEFQESGYFEEHKKSTNGTWMSGTPLKPGNVQVKATLFGTLQDGALKALPVPLTATAVLEIFDQIIIHPQITVFPWDPAARTTHQVMYTIKGGVPTTSYIWSSSNTSLSTVTQNGIAKGRGHLIGETIVTAAMSRATQNYGRAIIRVAPAIQIDIIDDHVKEAEIGKQLTVPVAFFASDKQAFSDCVGFPYNFQLNDDKTFSTTNKGHLVPSDSDNSACTSVTLVANSLGFTNVQVSYSYSAIDSDKVIQLTDESTIAAFKPLTPIQPESGSTLLAAGSSYHIVWSGGPQPWIKNPKSFFHKVNIEAEDQSIVSLGKRIQTSSGPLGGDLFAFVVTCQKIGQVELVLSVGNEKSETLPRPVIARSRVTIKCGEPDKLKLEADVPQPVDQTCPLMAKTLGRIPALCYEKLPVLVSVFDKSGQKFDNISTFDIGWSVSQTDLGTMPDKGILATREIGIEDTTYDIIGNKKTYQILDVKGLPGSVEVSAILKSSGSFLIGGFGSISDTLSLNLVNDAIISPDQIVIFNHPDNVVPLSIQHGSGFFEVTQTTGLGSIDHKYHVNNQSVSVVPLRAGETTLSVKDLCLITKRQPASARVQVTGIQTVDLLIVDKVQLGRNVVAQVKLRDEQGRTIPVEQLKYLDVKLIPSTKKIVKLQEKPNSAPEDLLFDVQGSELGLTMITAEVTYGKKLISSTPMPLHVFPPLSLEPRNITLIIGAKFQVQVVGGPHQQQDSTVEFQVGIPKIANSNTVGLITANTLGSTKLVGRVYGIDKSTGKRVVFSEDSVNVYVVKLEGIRIRAPVHIVSSGTELPLHATGLDIENQNAYSFGSARPNLQFHWTVSNQEVGNVVSVFHQNGIGQVNSGVARFIAKKPGRVVIKLRVTISSSLEIPNQFQLDRDREFQDQIEIKVLEDLAMRNPPLNCGNVVLMSPMSELQLTTNRDFSAGASTTYVTAESSSNPSVVTVDKNGLLVAGQNTGTSIIHVSVAEGEFSGVVQHTSVLVHVKPVKFAMLNVLSSFTPSSQSKLPAHLPKGITMGMELSYHDDLAKPFDAVHEAGAVQFRPSRFESNHISFSNQTSSIELVKVTETVLRAGHAVGHDFVIFDVRTAIGPHVKKVVAGDVIILQSSVAVDPGTENWLAEPQGILSIDSIEGEPNLGYAVALRGGQARVAYQFNKERRITLDLEVESAHKVSFNHSRHGSSFHLTNLPTKSQLVYVNIVPTSQNGDQNSPISANFHVPSGWVNSLTEVIPTNLFSCQASFLAPRPEFGKIFSVNPVFDPKEGSYACKIDPISEEVISSLFLSGEVELFVRPGAALLAHNPNIQGDSLTLKFTSTFKVKNSELLISNLGKRDELVVQGLSQVLESLTVQVSHPDFFYVGRPYSISTSDGESESDGSRDASERVAFLVSVKSSYWKTKRACASTFYVEVSEKMGLQNVKVPIQVVMDDKCSDANEPGWTSLLGFLLRNYEMFIVAVICVFVSWIYSVKKSSTQGGSTAASQGGPPNPSTSHFLNGSSQAPLGPASPTTSPMHLKNADNGIHLWTVDSYPIYGSPTSPGAVKKSPRNLAQYSYTNH